MKVQLHLLALAVAIGPAALAHAQYMPQTPNNQQDRDRVQQQNRDDQQDRDDQQGRPGWDNRGVNSGSISNLQNSIHQALPNSNVMANLQDQNTVVLTGAVATDRDRQEAVNIARQQAPNMRVIDQLTVGNVGAYGNYGNNGSYGNNGDYRNNGNYNGNNGSYDRDRDRNDNRAMPQGDVAPGTPTDRDRSNDAVRTDRDNSNNNSADRDRDNNNGATSDRDHDKNGKWDKKKDKDKKHKKDKDEKSKKDRDRDQEPH
jgi:hypothetical protein